jgi:restriction endonuclease S subunit
MLGIAAPVNQACLAIMPASDLTTRLLFHVFAGRYEVLRSLGHEGTQKNLSAKLVGDLFVPKPPKDEQDAVADILDEVRVRTEHENAVRTQLAAVKAALMSVLLTGEVRVTPDEHAA